MVRIKSILPVCEYNVEGVSEVRLIDFADFQGFGFLDDNLYDVCIVDQINASGTLKTLPAGDGSKYTGDSKSGLYSHTLDTFAPGLTGFNLATLNLATKRRQVVLFKTRAGRWYTFGYEAGATVNYTNQTADALGNLITITALSIYPLFEVLPEATTLQTSGDYRPADYDTINDYK